MASTATATDSLDANTLIACLASFSSGNTSARLPLPQDAAPTQLAIELNRLLDEHARLDELVATMRAAASGLAHEFANALLPAMIALRTLDDAPDAPGNPLETLRSSVHAVQDFVGALRRLAGDPHAEHEGHTACVATALRDALPLLRSAVHRGTTLELREPPPAIAVRLAPTPLTHLVLNLVLNASDAARAEARRVVRIDATSPQDSPALHLRISADAAQRHTPSTAARLASARDILRRAGGSLSLPSGEDAAVVEVLLPLARSDERNRPLAVVSLTEPRIRGYTIGVLQLAGFEVRDSLPDSHPGPAVWIADPSSCNAESVLEFTRARRDRRVLVYSDATPAPAPAGATTFAITPGPGSLRERLREYRAGIDHPATERPDQ